MASIDDGNGAERADWLMSARTAFCRAYPGQIALIISFRAAQSELVRRNAEGLAPATALETVRATYFYKLAFLKSPYARIIRAG
jgi:hypothetical protein